MGERIFKKIKIWLGYLLDIIFPLPELCNGCGRELKEYSHFKLCPMCLSKVSIYHKNNNNEIGDNEDIRVAYDDCIVACNYDGLVREMVHKIKYKDKREIAITIAAIMADNIKKEKLDYDYIVPVPISSKKLKKRGYNHMKLVVLELTTWLKIPVLDCLSRTRETKPQVLLNVNDRWYNVMDCFICNDIIYGKRILLVDDIITTGATAHYCAKELKTAGAEYVTVFSFAKSNLQ